MKVPAAVFPGTFNPPTVAHLAVATAAWEQAGLDTVELVLSEVPLGKEQAFRLPVDERLQILSRVAASRPWMRARSTTRQLIADIAEGYDYLIVGADKWAQLVDPAWYGGSLAARDEALARLPPVLVAPRPPFPLPPGTRHLLVQREHQVVSSTAARAGRWEWILPEAAEHARRLGGWGPEVKR